MLPDGPQHGGRDHTAIVPSDDLPTLAELVEALTLRAGHNTTTVLIAVTLLGLAAGVVGAFALLRNRSLVSDAISHATLPGIAAAFLIAVGFGGTGRSLPVLLVGATLTSVLAVLCMHAILRHTRLREDAAIGIVLSVFFGAGIVGLSYIQTNAPAGAAGIDQFVYGQTAAMSVQDARVMAGIACTSVIAAVLFLKELSLVCFNDVFARADGWPVSLLDLVMMALVVLVTVAGLQAVGLILIIALLIIPPVSARFWTNRLWVMVVLSGLIGAGSGYIGAAVSALLPRQPAGSVIVLTAGTIFVIGLVGAPKRGVVALVLRRTALRVRIAAEHLLETAYDTAEPNSKKTAMLTADAVSAIARDRAWPRWMTPAVRRLVVARGYGRSSHAGIELTQAGLARGARISRNHALWSQYLMSYADIAPNHVDWSVDQIEHVLSDELIAELEDALAERGIAVPSGVPAGGSA